jgi:hypothetical protein
MHRTHISLEREQYQWLVREARKRGISPSTLLRELIVARYRPRKVPPRAPRPAVRLA